MNEDLIEKIVRRVLEALDARRRSHRASVPATWPPKHVALGSDHGGFDLKQDLLRHLHTKGFDVVDCGTRGTESVDYPDYARAVAEKIKDGSCEAGIVVDAFGIGSAMAANKVAGVRCAVCHDVAGVINSREHNDANVLSLGAKVVPPALARRMATLWLSTACAGDRHLRRVRKIMEIES